MRVMPIVAACAVLFVAGSTQADPLKVLKPIDACTLKAGEQATCLTARFDAASQSLDATIAAIKSHFPAGAPYVSLFDLSHDAWFKEVAQTCRAAAMAHGENGGGVVDLRCRIEMTAARETLLKKLYAL